ncbi:MAG: MFS transporter [Gammaproteobacteria bacterium]|nr:MAG: MFS transporter [Gammaproteobacteria bacterium]
MPPSQIPAELSPHAGWRRPEVLLLLMAAGVPLSFATWTALLNNFAIEVVAFDGSDMGILQSVREVPGFLALLVVFALYLMREQTLAVISLAILGIGTALTGYFPSLLGLCLTTFLASTGFHYYETIQQSLTLQWTEKHRTAEVLGRLIAVGSFAGIVSYGLVWLGFRWAGIDYVSTYMIAGGLTLVIAIAAAVLFPRFPQKVEQHRTLILRRRYWLFYALVFMAGARRQIFMVFAGFLLVERFAYAVEEIALLFLLNNALNIPLAPYIGRLIGRFGERPALVFEYAGLTLVFIGYAFVSNAFAAAGLYVLDHLFFALAIAIRTYLQKIGDPADMASTAGVSFTINHIAAIVIPVAFGFIWLVSPAAVFLGGAAMAVISLILALFVPDEPGPGNEVIAFGTTPAVDRAGGAG